MKPAIKHPKLNPSREPELQELARHIGKFIEYWGFKSVQGKIWCNLYLSQKPLSSIEISRLLKISAPLVTQSVKVLLHYDVIERAEKGPNGVLRFQANPNISQPILKVLKGRERTILQEIQKLGAKTEKSLSRDPQSGYQIDSKKLAQLQQWISFASTTLETAVLILSQEVNPLSHE